MARVEQRCAVCRIVPDSTNALSRVVIEGRCLSLCRRHALVVATQMPETFEEFRALFVGLGSSFPGERRSPIPRREALDRRVFPPRPEGRRGSVGRRATDVAEEPPVSSL